MPTDPRACNGDADCWIDFKARVALTGEATTVVRCATALSIGPGLNLSICGHDGLILMRGGRGTDNHTFGIAGSEGKAKLIGALCAAGARKEPLEPTDVLGVRRAERESEEH